MLAVAATSGAVSVVPTLPKAWLGGSPFADYTVPALALGIVIGGGACAAALLLAVRYRWAWIASVVVGLAMAMFEIVEVTVVGLDYWLHALGLPEALNLQLPVVDL